MSSNVQTQINDLNAAVQALDSSLTQITGNTMSNYNQLSRIVAQQANIYNTLYYGSGNLTSGNLVINGNAIITGNLNVDNGTMWVDNVNNRVGINTTSPIASLNVNGTANIGTSTFQLHIAKAVDTSGIGCRINGQDNTGNTIIQPEQQGVSFRNLLLNPLGGGVGVGTTNPKYTLDVNGDANINGNLLFNTDGDGIDFYGTGNKLYKKIGSGITCETSLFTVANITGASTLLQVNTTNNRVGINTTSPTTDFNVNGSANIGSSTFQLQLAKSMDASGIGCEFRAQDSTGNTLIQAIQQGVSYRNLLLNPFSGNVGVGTTNPKYTLDVNGDANITGNVSVGGWNSSSATHLGYQSLSGASSRNWTGIPSWANETTITIDGASTTGGTVMLIQIGISSGYITTGYYSSTWTTLSSSATTITTTGATIWAGAGSAPDPFSGTLKFIYLGTNGSTYYYNITGTGIGIGSSTYGTMTWGRIYTSEKINSIRVTTTSGTYDAGIAGVYYF